MDSMNKFQQAIAVGTLVIFLYYLRKWTSIFTRTHKAVPPEPTGAWPIIGHLHFLAGGENQLLYRTLGSMADKYGPIFTIRLGMRQVLVVSNSEIAKECFTTNDTIISSRPNSILAVKLMAYNSAMLGFAPYGPYWRELRKIAVIELLSSRRLEILKNIRISEIDMSIKDLYQLWDEKMKGGGVVLPGSPVLVEMKKWFGDFSFNVVVRMIAGKRYLGRRNESDDCEEEEARRCQKAMNDFMHLLGIFVVSDAIPFLRFLDLQGYEKEMKKTAVEIDYVLGRWVEEHRQQKMKRVTGASDGDGDHQDDFIDVMLSILKDDENFYGHDADTVIKSSCLSLILGGNDTLSATLTWALSLLLNNHNVLEKAQSELDIHVGRERQVDESDINNLKYLQAIVKETMRLYPAAPLSAPREATEDCTIAGFHVPKGTQLMFNLWKLHRDPRVWSDPLEFKPERFLTSGTHGDVDVRGQHFELLPFGGGRRICPGISLANQVLHLVTARLLHSFHLSTPYDYPVDMTESSGLSCPRANPLDVLLTPRLPAELYVC